MRYRPTLGHKIIQPMLSHEYTLTYTVSLFLESWWVYKLVSLASLSCSCPSSVPVQFHILVCPCLWTVVCQVPRCHVLMSRSTFLMVSCRWSVSSLQREAVALRFYLRPCSVHHTTHYWSCTVSSEHYPLPDWHIAHDQRWPPVWVMKAMGQKILHTLHVQVFDCTVWYA